jgi:hypothetical protein
MKRLVLLSLVVSAAAVAQVVHSAHGSGSFMFASTAEHISFSAVERAVGPDSGSAEVHDITAGVNAHIEVDCLNVIGNVATISGIVTKSSDPTLEGFEGIFQVMDNGEGKDAPPDLISLVNFFAVGIGNDCRVPGEFDLVPVQHGNVQVE